MLELVEGGRRVGERLERLDERHARILHIEPQPERHLELAPTLHERRGHVRRRELAPPVPLVVDGHQSQHIEPCRLHRGRLFLEHGVKHLEDQRPDPLVLGHVRLLELGQTHSPLRKEREYLGDHLVHGVDLGIVQPEIVGAFALSNLGTHLDGCRLASLLPFTACLLRLQLSSRILGRLAGLGRDGTPHGEQPLHDGRLRGHRVELVRALGEHVEILLARRGARGREDEHEQREEHRHRRRLDEEREDLLERQVDVRGRIVVRACARGHARAEVLVVYLGVAILVVLADIRVLHLHLRVGAHASLGQLESEGEIPEMGGPQVGKGVLERDDLEGKPGRLACVALEKARADLRHLISACACEPGLDRVVHRRLLQT